MDDRLYEYIKADITEMKQDIKALLQFKWQIIGSSVVVSLVVGVILQIAIATFGK